MVFNLNFVKRFRAQTKSYTEHPYLVAMALVKWKFHPLELLRHLYSEEPELDLKALPILLKIEICKKIDDCLALGEKEAGLRFCFWTFEFYFSSGS